MGLANDEIGPLDNDNGDEEGSVAGVFKDFMVPENNVQNHSTEGHEQVYYR